MANIHIVSYVVYGLTVDVKECTTCGQIAKRWGIKGPGNFLGIASFKEQKDAEGLANTLNEAFTKGVIYAAPLEIVPEVSDEVSAMFSEAFKQGIAFADSQDDRAVKKFLEQEG